jgi:hypothetical protein
MTFDLKAAREICIKLGLKYPAQSLMRLTIDISILPTGEFYADMRQTSESCEFVWHLGSGRWLA